MVNLQRWRFERDLGYAMTARIPMRMPSGLPIYDMVFATDHPVGNKIMTDLYKKAAEREPLMRQEAKAKAKDKRSRDAGLDTLFDLPALRYLSSPSPGSRPTLGIPLRGPGGIKRQVSHCGIQQFYAAAPARAGISSQTRPSSWRPPALGVRPPHCLKKNGTDAFTQLSGSSSPMTVERPVIGARLAARNDPVDASQIQAVQWPEQRLARKEPHCGGHRAQVIHARQGASCPRPTRHPQVRRPVKPVCDLRQPRRALGQHLIGVLRGMRRSRRKPHGQS